MALINPTSFPFTNVGWHAAAAPHHRDSSFSFVNGSDSLTGSKVGSPSHDTSKTSGIPWTHEPVCFPVLPGQPGADVVDEYCVYTKASTEATSISIVATPDLADHLAHNTGLGLQSDGRILEAPYTKRRTADRGTAVFASRRIQAGELIMTDHPFLLVMTQAYWQLTSSQIQDAQWLALMQLPPEIRRTARDLARSSKGNDELESIMRTNSIRVDNGRQFLALAPQAARINHACRPNAAYRYTAPIHALEVFALRDIEEGEEITYSYLDVKVLESFSTEDRRRLLKDKWGFNCSCDLCSAYKPQSRGPRG